MNCIDNICVLKVFGFCLFVKCALKGWAKRTVFTPTSNEVQLRQFWLLLLVIWLSGSINGLVLVI